MADNQHEKNERDFTWILQLSSAVCLGGLAAFLFSVKAVTPNVQVEFSAGSVAAFVLAAAFSWAFWRFVLTKASPAEPGSTASDRRLAGRVRVRFVLLATLLLVAMLGAFAWELRDVSQRKRMEVMQGVALAVALLAGVGWIFWKLIRFLESDQERLQHRPTDESDDPDARPRP
jgi:hypothetical protein